ncbi:YvrJ family protein [Salipaludibacillus sp. HK11]|uniref:YvrJ family protein n=1 Tax=Salipaludibacillus sp. HK11 TaxID=3394320 RepID=UPI0039FB8D83
MEHIWLTAVSEYGFPVVITFYLLYRIEKKLDKLNKSVLLIQSVCPFNKNKYMNFNSTNHADNSDKNKHDDIRLVDQSLAKNH